MGEIVLRISKLRALGRIVSMVFLLAAMMGPWFADSHPAAEETCPPPLVWLGDGYCACRISFTAFVTDTISGQSSLWFFSLPVALPPVSTLFLFLIGERRWLWVSHLAAWGISALFSLLWFFGVWFAHRGVLILWGAGFGGAAAVPILVWEILIWKRALELNVNAKVCIPVTS
jgi:hypothetical protein